MKRDAGTRGRGDAGMGRWGGQGRQGGQGGQGRNSQTTTNNQQPTTNNQQPITNNQQPTTNNQYGHTISSDCFYTITQRCFIK
ncbi:MAG: hypothetical protein F6K47_13570 [Symploca sp. SIO2E6]|nr:hypothetical protein [Symploca sp. SIO2E6]